MTALQAAQEMEAGDIWAASTFPMRSATKSSLYRREVMQTAIKAMLEAVTHFATGTYRPEPLKYRNTDVRGKLCPSMQQTERAIDWNIDRTEDVVRKINAADSNPGLSLQILAIEKLLPAICALNLCISRFKLRRRD